MATIKERAKMQARLLVCKNCGKFRTKTFICDLSENICSLEGDEDCEENYAAFQAYISASVEQDQISRQEEREWCIREVIYASCGRCYFYHEGECIHMELTGFENDCCKRMKKIRKALEGGEE